MSSSDELIEILDLGSARGGRRLEAPLEVEVVRSLGEDDLRILAEPVDSPRQSIAKLRSSHHALARQLAMNGSVTEASLATGYSIPYISNLAGHDPTFKELVAEYRNERQALFVDAIKRLRSLGIDAVEELQDRLAQEPEGFTKNELMGLAKMALVDTLPRGGSGGGEGPAGGTTVNIKFVAPGGPSGPTITLDPIDVKSED